MYVKFIYIIFAVVIMRMGMCVWKCIYSEIENNIVVKTTMMGVKKNLLKRDNK